MGGNYSYSGTSLQRYFLLLFPKKKLNVSFGDSQVQLNLRAKAGARLPPSAQLLALISRHVPQSDIGLEDQSRQEPLE